MSKKYHLFKRPSKNMPEVHVTSKLLPSNFPNVQEPQIPTYIVIHEVSTGLGKSPENYNMEHYYNKIYEAGKNGSSIGYHYLVGDKEIYQFIPDTVATSHTGTFFGNSNSIGIERLICKGVNYEYAIHNQAKLTATLMLKHNIPLNHVLTHKQMQLQYGSEVKKANPTPCPSRLISGFRGTFVDFKTEIKRCFMYGWFFKELLTEEQIKELPIIQELALKKYTEEINRQKETRHSSSNDLDR